MFFGQLGNLLDIDQFKSRVSGRLYPHELGLTGFNSLSDVLYVSHVYESGVETVILHGYLTDVSSKWD